MHIRAHSALVAALLMAAARAAQACPHQDSQASCGAANAAVAPAREASAIVPWKQRPWSPATSAVQANGLWVSRDPIDGTLSMPDFPATMAAEARIRHDDETPLLVERFADGTISAHLDDRWAEFAVATLGQDGKPTWDCVSGRDAAARFMAHPVIVPAPPSVKREDK